MNEKNLALFIHELLMILYNNDLVLIDDNLVGFINTFIYRYYNEYRDSFSLLFNDMDLLDEFFKENYEVLPIEVVIYLYRKYGTLEKYAQLVEDVGHKNDDKINDLAIAFVMYYQELVELSERKPNGPFKILH